MNINEQLQTLPGFLYQIGQTYYFLGKWICKPCSETDITDCHAMYEICQAAGETENVQTYFHKLRAYSDFALDIPYNPGKISTDLTGLLDSLSPSELEHLRKQIELVAALTAA